MREQTVDFPYGRWTHLLGKGCTVVRGDILGATLCGIPLASRMAAFTGDDMATCKTCRRRWKLKADDTRYDTEATTTSITAVDLLTATGLSMAPPSRREGHS